MVGSGYITAVTLQQKFNYTGKAYVLGTPSLAAELSQVGITAIGTGVSCCHRCLHGAAFTFIQVGVEFLPWQKLFLSGQWKNQ